MELTQELLEEILLTIATTNIEKWDIFI